MSLATVYSWPVESDRWWPHMVLSGVCEAKPHPVGMLRALCLLSPGDRARKPLPTGGNSALTPVWPRHSIQGDRATPLIDVGRC